MSNNSIKIICSRCGHTWYQDLSLLDEPDQVIYRDGEPQQKTYWLPCPQCGTNNIVTIRFKEAQDG